MAGPVKPVPVTFVLIPGILHIVAGMLCFSVPHKKKAPAMPKMILHLDDADWDLPRENYVLDVDIGDDDDGTCVVIHEAGGSGMTG